MPENWLDAFGLRSINSSLASARKSIRPRSGERSSQVIPNRLRIVQLFGLLVHFAPGAHWNFVPLASAQTAVTGGLNGVVTDSTGAIVPNAKVTIVNSTTGDSRVLATNDHGLYTAPFLKPGTYRVSARAQGLQSTTTSVEILVGQQSVANLTVSPSASTQTVTVSAHNEQLIQTEDASLTTTFTSQQFENLPNPGGDITTFAFTVPGVVVNTGTGGNGNFSSSGLPGISNLIILNGADQTDSFFNDATTGASTLSIGASEIDEA